jgi:hypothetical protein
MVKFGLLAPSIATIKAITMKEGSGANNNEKNKVLQEEDIDYDPDCISTISSDDSNSDSLPRAWT